LVRRRNCSHQSAKDLLRLSAVLALSVACSVLLDNQFECIKVFCCWTVLTNCFFSVAIFAKTSIAEKSRNNVPASSSFY
jgi:hypothetical protein